MNKNEIELLKGLLETPKKIVIIPHKSPDGDAIGSSLGMLHFLEKLQHSVTIISPNDFPEFLAWLPGTEDLFIYESDKTNCEKIILEADLIFTLDFNAFPRTGDMENVLKKVTAPFVMVDHHQQPDSYATVTYSDVNFGSTCEMIYNLMEFLGYKNLIDKTIATCLYTGILTDSGGFKFPKTTGATHRIVAEFIDLGVENTSIPNQLFDNNSYERLQLLGRSLEKMKVDFAKKTAYTFLSQADLNEFKYQKGDTEGNVNYGLSIKGIVFAAIFIEHKEENIIKISFRSQGNFDVNNFARQYFQGGGHINAAGGKSYESLENTVKKFETILQNLIIE